MRETTTVVPSWSTYRVILGGLILAAWLALVIWVSTPYAALLDHHEIEGSTFSALVRWPAFLGGWTLMVLAMMLPGSLPLLRSLTQAAAMREAASRHLLGAFLPGYLAIWLAFGAAIYLGDTLLHEGVEAGLVPDAERLIPVVLLVVAALYQFAPLKQKCRAKCKVAQLPAGEAKTAMFAAGVHAGLLCLATCGATMLVMFALGGGSNLALMAVLTALMLVERVTEFGRFVAWPFGLVLLLGAAVKLVG